MRPSILWWTAAAAAAVSGAKPDAHHTDLETVIADLMAGQYSDPMRVVAFNITECWARDVSLDVAREIQERADLAFEDISSSLQEFVSYHTAPRPQLSERRT
jgi:Ni,Fe-hydrogenase maturation factor